ncbi:MAG: hypothetical protein VKL59_04640 [Nostocaceae cyanobacterium]|nr:hypothetical protein [Nostocaceae cyanobacterium]
MGHWALGIGHWAWGMGHWALGIGHGAWGMGHWALGINFFLVLLVFLWAMSYSPFPIPHYPYQ